MTLTITTVWSGDDSDEAIVTISDGVNEARCYAHPLEVAPETPKEPMLALEVAGVARTVGLPVGIRHFGDAFEHEVRGVVVSLAPPVLAVGELLLDLGLPLPGDVVVGDVVECVVSRLDYQG